jgi:Transglycosylase SLT domain
MERLQRKAVESGDVGPAQGTAPERRARPASEQAPSRDSVAQQGDNGSLGAASGAGSWDTAPGLLSAMGLQAEEDGDSVVTLADLAGSAAGGQVVQRKPSKQAVDLQAVKSKEIEAAEDREQTDWPGVVAREKNRHKDLDYLLTLKNTDVEQAALKGLKGRWAGTVVTQPSFDPVSGVLDAAKLKELLAADAQDAGKLTAKKFGSLVEWVTKLGKALNAFLELRQRIGEERVEFNRFDDAFLDPDVATALAAVPGGFRPADLKAMLAQETGDFTDTNIAGLENKKKGIVNKLEPNPSFVGVGQINTGADADARKVAKELGIKLPPSATGDKDPRKDPATGIKLAANYLAYIGKQLASLPAGAPTGAEMRKLVLAAYNGGPFGLIKAAKAVSSKGAYTWATISANEAAMSNFLKPGEVRDYVKRVTERAP